MDEGLALLTRAITIAIAMLWAMPVLAQVPVPGQPQDAWKEKEDPRRAKGLAACTAGDRVLASYDGRWLPAEVIAVDTAAPYPCKVRLVGQPASTDAAFAAWMLRPAP